LTSQYKNCIILYIITYTNEITGEYVRIVDAISVLVCTSQMMWLSWIIIYSSVLSLMRLILNSGGMIDWINALTLKSIPVDHPAVLFNHALSLDKGIQGIVFIVIVYLCLFVTVSMVESLLYPYVLDSVRNTLPDFGWDFWRKWKKFALFFIMFTPIWILSGLLGYTATVISQGTNFPTIVAELIKFTLMSVPLIILIPARFYYSDGYGFLRSIMESLLNIQKYFKSTILILIPSGCIYVFLVQLTQNSMTGLQTLLSFSPLLYALGALFWFAWAVSVFYTVRIYQNINRNTGGYS